MYALKHEFTGRKISPWGGIKYFQQVFVRSGIRDYIDSLEELPHPLSNRGYKAIDLIEGFLTSVVLGARRLEHCGMLRTDEVITEIFGWQKGMGSASTFQRFLHKFDEGLNARIFPTIMKHVFSRMLIPHMTIDLDSSVVTRYGKQQKAEVGYNPHKKGRPSHHPLMAFCDELKMVVNGWMRPGKTQSSSGGIDFIKEVLHIVGPEHVGLLRADVGFYSHRIMKFLEGQEKPLSYLFKVRMTAPVYKKIVEQPKWLPNDSVVPGAIYSEIRYKSSGWKDTRRVILVGIPKKQSDQHQQPTDGWLFWQYKLADQYEFQSYITNTTLSMVEVHRTYNQRGDAENRIRELKYDYAMDGFSMNCFSATDAAFRFVLLAYNLMAIFKQQVLQPRVNHRLSTLKFQCIAIGSYLVQTGRKKILKLAAQGKRRHFLEHLFENVELLKPNYVFSTA